MPDTINPVLFDYAKIVPALMPPNVEFERNVRDNWPVIASAMKACGQDSTLCFIGAMATVRVETGHFTPIAELGDKRYFQQYDLPPKKMELGNEQPGDGFRFRGRGYIQLTGRTNYTTMTKMLDAVFGVAADLVNHPDNALQPTIASCIFADYWRDHHSHHIRGGKIVDGITLKQACETKNWVKVRELVNGGHNGLQLFSICVNNLLKVCCTCAATGRDEQCVLHG